MIIQHAIWLYLRFILSYRDVEELLAERGLDISAFLNPSNQSTGRALRSAIQDFTWS